MKAIFLAVVLMCLCLAANATATYRYSFHDLNSGDPFSDSFTGAGTFTVAVPDLSIAQPLLTFTGTFSDDFVSNAAITLIPTGRTVVAGYGLIFVYDNLIGDADGNLFNSAGVLFQAGNTSHVNLFSNDAGILFAYDFHTQSDGSPGGFFAAAPIAFEAQLVPEPSVLFLLVMGFACWTVGRTPALKRSFLQ